MGMPVALVKPLKAAINTEVFLTKQDFLKAAQARMSKETYQAYHLNILQFAEVLGRFNGESYTEFLKPLIENNDRHVVLIENGAPYHG